MVKTGLFWGCSLELGGFLSMHDGNNPDVLASYRLFSDIAPGSLARGMHQPGSHWKLWCQSHMATIWRRIYPILTELMAVNKSN